MDIYERLKELGIQLPAVPEPVGLFQPATQVGNVVYLSGQGSFIGDTWVKGKVGAECSLEDAQVGARLCMLNLLAVLDHYLGDLNRVKRPVKLLGFVNGAPDFDQQPAVINGASQLLLDVFGENGKHARSAIGAGSLPMGIACEIEAIFELKE